jgi:mannose-6-phosphate isomerase-like protein (cupin superfamily)
MALVASYGSGMSTDATTNDFTHVNLADLDDLAARYGYGEIGEARFARVPLGAEQSGLSLQLLRPGRRGLAHRHGRVEEIYVVLSGSGQMRIDDETIELRPRDAVRVAPGAVRSFEAGPEGLEYLAMGPHADDAEITQAFPA